MARSTFWKPDEGFNPDKIEDSVIREIVQKHGNVETNIRTAKKLLKAHGGRAWTEHYERNGTMFEVTEVLLGGNNSIHRYNRHL